MIEFKFKKGQKVKTTRGHKACMYGDNACPDFSCVVVDIGPVKIKHHDKISSGWLVPKNADKTEICKQCTASNAYNCRLPYDVKTIYGCMKTSSNQHNSECPFPGYQRTKEKACCSAEINGPDWAIKHACSCHCDCDTCPTCGGVLKP
jgi:hypothetical protein